MDTTIATLAVEPPTATGHVQTVDQFTLDAEGVRLIDAYWRAANYLSVGQIYLYDNPLLREPLTLAHVKPLVVGHWGTTPGQNFIYAHLNRVIKQYDLDMFYVAGPGHGGPAIVGNVYLEGTWSEVYPNVTQDEAGLKKLFTQFSFPGGISSHVAPTTPGSIHEGGELGYSLSHAFGAAFDNPGLIVACVVGDGEAETGPLATAWQSNKLLNPVSDGAVLPILHLNGFKISNPTVLARIEHEELEQFFRGCGWTPYFVEGDDPETMHRLMAATLDQVVADIRTIQQNARSGQDTSRPRWPMIVLRSPKGWTGPKLVDGLKVEGTFRAHQVPLLVDAAHPEHVAELESWMRSYKAEELFDANGRLIPELAALAPKGDRRMGANPHANGGLLLHDLRMPDFRDHAVDVPAPGAVIGEDTTVLGTFLRDVAWPTRSSRTSASSARTRRCRTCSAPCSRSLRGSGTRARSPTTSSWRRRPRRRLDAQRAPVRGLPGGLPAHRTPRAVQQLRGLHPHRRRDVQPARQVAEGRRRSCRGGGRSRRSTTCSPPMSGSRTTTASPTRTRASSTTS